jgi:hypothetical protein
MLRVRVFSFFNVVFLFNDVGRASATPRSAPPWLLDDSRLVAILASCSVYNGADSRKGSCAGEGLASGDGPVRVPAMMALAPAPAVSVSVPVLVPVSVSVAFPRPGSGSGSGSRPVLVLFVPGEGLWTNGAEGSISNHLANPGSRIFSCTLSLMSEDLRRNHTSDDTFSKMSPVLPLSWTTARIFYDLPAIFHVIVAVVILVVASSTTRFSFFVVYAAMINFFAPTFVVVIFFIAPRLMAHQGTIVYSFGSLNDFISWFWPLLSNDNLLRLARRGFTNDDGLRSRSWVLPYDDGLWLWPREVLGRLWVSFKAVRAAIGRSEEAIFAVSFDANLAHRANWGWRWRPGRSRMTLYTNFLCWSLRAVVVVATRNSHFVDMVWMTTIIVAGMALLDTNLVHVFRTTAAVAAMAFGDADLIVVRAVVGDANFFDLFRTVARALAFSYTNLVNLIRVMGGRAASVTLGDANLVNLIRVAGRRAASVALGDANLINLIRVARRRAASMALGDANLVNLIRMARRRAASVALGDANLVHLQCMMRRGVGVPRFSLPTVAVAILIAIDMAKFYSLG